MDVFFPFNGIVFVWNDQKAQINPDNHDGVTFQQAVEAFLIRCLWSLMQVVAMKNVVL
jgi:uncharacterized DUF497 family protein